MFSNCSEFGFVRGLVLIIFMLTDCNVFQYIPLLNHINIFFFWIYIHDHNWILYHCLHPHQQCSIFCKTYFDAYFDAFTNQAFEAIPCDSWYSWICQLSSSCHWWHSISFIHDPFGPLTSHVTSHHVWCLLCVTSVPASSFCVTNDKWLISPLQSMTNSNIF